MTTAGRPGHVRTDDHGRDRRPTGDRARGHQHLRRGQAGRRRHPGALPRRTLRPGRRLPDVRGRHRRPRVRRRLRAALRGRHDGHDRHPGARPQPGHADRAADRRPAAAGGGPQADHDRRQPAARRWPTGTRWLGETTELPVRLRPRHRLVQPGHRGQPRRLHPLRPLRAGLRRHPGQRRDRPRPARATRPGSRST